MKSISIIRKIDNYRLLTRSPYRFLSIVSIVTDYRLYRLPTPGNSQSDNTGLRNSSEANRSKEISRNSIKMLYRAEYIGIAIDVNY